MSSWIKYLEKFECNDFARCFNKKILHIKQASIYFIYFFILYNNNLLTKLGKITNRLNNQNHQIDLSIVLGFYWIQFKNKMIVFKIYHKKIPVL